MSFSIEKVFSSHGCTNFKGCLKTRHRDTIENISLVAHACGNDIIVSDGEKNKELYLLRSHKSHVTCIDWIQDYSEGIEESQIKPEKRLVSSDSTGSICIWIFNDNGFELESQFSLHKGSIEAIHSGCIYDDETQVYEPIIISTGSDQYIQILSYHNHEWSIYTQFKTVGDIYYTCITSTILHYNETCLFFGCIDSTIHVYTLLHRNSIKEDDSTSLVFVTKIKGHEDWVTCIDICKTHSLNPEYLLVSGSKDGRGRIYTIQEDTDDVNEMKEVDNLSTLCMDNHKYICIFEVLLLGHSDWITQVQFYPLQKIDSNYIQLPYLLSSSMDGTCILWKPQYIYKYIYDVHTITCYNSKPENHHLDVFLPSTTFSAHIPGQQGFLGIQWSCQHTCPYCLLNTSQEPTINLHSVVYAYGYGGGLYKWCEHKQELTDYDITIDNDNYIYIDLKREDIHKGSEDSSYSLILNEKDNQYCIPGTFERCIAHGGHTGSVKDICWSRAGSTFITCGDDCTVRVWGQYYYNNDQFMSLTTNSIEETDTCYRKNDQFYYNGIWNEVFRPCIHGYPLTKCLCLDDLSNTCSYTYQGEDQLYESELPLLCIGCEEKKIRMYTNTLIFQDYVRKCLLTKFIHRNGNINYDHISSSVYWSAYLPELGLTSRGITCEDKNIFLDKVSKGEVGMNMNTNDTTGDDDNEEMNTTSLEDNKNREIDVNITYDNVATIDRFVTESRLYRGTLFNESRVLYGLDNLSCLSLLSNHKQTLIFGTTSGKIPEDVAIHIWNKDTGALISKLPAGKMSITSLSISTDDMYLIAAGRERCIYVYKYQKNEKNEDNYIYINKIEKAHKRIIWCGQFIPIDINKKESNLYRYIYITGDRDGNAIMREIDTEDQQHVLYTFPSLSSSIMCMDISPLTHYKNNNGYFCVFGLEDSTLSIWFIPENTYEPSFIMTVPTVIAPSLCVNSIQFSTKAPNYFAVTSSDSGVYLYHIINE